MADHLQQQILEAVQANLIAAGTAAGSRVFLDRVDEITQAELPAFHIEGVGEDDQADSLNFPTVYTRQYRFTVAALVHQSTGSAKAARNLGQNAEVALLATLAGYTASGKAKALQLLGSNENKDGSSALNFFEVRQSWQATYMTLGGSPDTPI
jgi:hypothetical protein